MPGPLEGVRVVDLTTVMYGPYCTQIMGEMGADVIKVEPPGGDVTRLVGPARHRGMSASILMKGKNKRSIVLDLSKESAREALGRIVAKADVFIHNMRPRAADKLRIAYDDVRRFNPQIVYCAAVGYGRDGPYRDKPAYDDLIQGASGLAALMGGMLGGEPRYVPSVLADKTSGLFALYAILMALFHRERTGEGQAVDVSMFEAFTSFVMNEHLQASVFEPPLGPPGYARLLSPNRRPYATRDGHICVLPYTDRHWRRFFEIAGRPELADDARFVDMPARTENINALYGIVADVLPQRTTAEWLEAFEQADIAAMPVNTPQDLFTDPHLQAVGFFEESDHPSEGRIRTMRPPIRMSKTPPGSERPAPRLGEHSREILSEAGLSEEEISELFEEEASLQGN